MARSDGGGGHETAVIAYRPLLAPRLPADLDTAWFAKPAEANAMIADADIAWVDMQPTELVADAIRDELAAAGVEVMDGDSLGWDWKIAL